jgi:hypothetical protein
VIEFKVAMAIFVTLISNPTTFISKTFFWFWLPYWIQSGQTARGFWCQGRRGQKYYFQIILDNLY